MSGSLQREVYDLLVKHSALGLSTSELTKMTGKSYTVMRRVIPTLYNIYVYDWRRVPNNLKIRDAIPWEPVWKAVDVPAHAMPPVGLQLHLAYHLNFSGPEVIRRLSQNG